jgi:hypothetical protein
MDVKAAWWETTRLPQSRHKEIGVFGFCLYYMVLSGGLSGKALPGCLILKVYLRSWGSASMSEYLDKSTAERSPKCSITMHVLKVFCKLYEPSLSVGPKNMSPILEQY